MVTGSLVIGIQDYAHRHYRESHNRLRYATSDAYDFHAYVRSAWENKSEASNQLLIDRNASISSLEHSANQLVKLGKLDLLLVYLSGHGEQEGDNYGWFCLADAEPGVPSLDSGLLDKLLSPIKADRMVLFIDCCYAEAVVSGSVLFNNLGAKNACLFICSARINQRAWEEENLKQSVFSHFLLFALSTDSPIASPTGHVDIDSKLFPYLREKVPLRVFAMKRGLPQEPIKGGYLSSPIELPTVDSEAMSRELSIVETIRVYIRRIISVTAITLLAVLGVADLLVYHLAINTAGSVEVRPGSHALFELLPFHLSGSIDTGITINDLDINDRDTFKALAEGKVWGIRSHRNSQGLPKWLEQVEAAMSQSAAWRMSMLAKKSPLEDDQSLDVENIPPTDIFFFLNEMGAPGATETANRLYQLPYDNIGFNCTDNAGSHLDFIVLNPDSNFFIQDLLWLAATVPRENNELFNRIEKLVLLSGYRSFHAGDQDEIDATLDEFETLGQALWAIERYRAQKGINGLEEEEDARLLTMTETWCRLPALLAFGLLGNADAQHYAEAEFLTSVQTYNLEEQGDLLNGNQRVALKALTILATKRPLSTETVQGMFNFIAKDDRHLEGVRDFVDWLAYIATQQPLPKNIVRFLVSELKRTPEEFEFFQLSAFNILARASHSLEQDVIDELHTWVETHIDEHRTQSTLAEGIGYLSSVMLIPIGWSNVITEQIRPDVYFSSVETTARGTLIIRSTDHAAGVALGRIVQHQSVDKALGYLLLRFALARPLIEERREVIKGLAKSYCAEPEQYTFFGISKVSLASCLHRKILEARSDSVRQSLDTEIAAQRILMEPVSQQSTIISKLQEQWESETEPEVRIALAKMIAQVRINVFTIGS